MSLLVTDKGSAEPVPEGVHTGICYLVADLGHQHSEKYGTEKRQVAVGFELPEVRIIIEKDGQKRDMPRAASRRFSLSLNEKAELRKFLQAWRGRTFTPDELKGFDLKNVIGVPALVQIVHERKSDGKVIHRIVTVMQLPKGTPRPRLENEPQFFSLDECPPDKPIVIPENIPDWIRRVLEQSREWSERMGGKSALKAKPATGTNGTGSDEADGADVPF